MGNDDGRRLSDHPLIVTVIALGAIAAVVAVVLTIVHYGGDGSSKAPETTTSTPGTSSPHISPPGPSTTSTGAPQPEPPRTFQI